MPFDPNVPQENTDLDAAQVRAQLNALKALVDAAAPIGSVKSWLKNFPGVPPLTAQWAECNGQILSDAASPLNGQTLPNLNGEQRFLRGASVSGGTGGSDTLNLGGEVPVDDNQDANTTSVASAPQPDLPILPSYYEVVWVMRIK